MQLALLMCSSVCPMLAAYASAAGQAVESLVASKDYSVGTRLWKSLGNHAYADLYGINAAHLPVVSKLFNIPLTLSKPAIADLTYHLLAVMRLCCEQSADEAECHTEQNSMLNKRLHTCQTWQVNGTQQAYVASEQALLSSTHCFDASTGYIKCKSDTAQIQPRTLLHIRVASYQTTEPSRNHATNPTPTPSSATNPTLTPSMSWG